MSYVSDKVRVFGNLSETKFTRGMWSPDNRRGKRASIQQDQAYGVSSSPTGRATSRKGNFLDFQGHSVSSYLLQDNTHAKWLLTKRAFLSLIVRS